MGTPVPELSEGTIKALSRFDWPGNVQQLKNAVEYAVCMAQDGMVKMSDLPLDVLKSRHVSVIGRDGDDAALPATFGELEFPAPLEKIEREAIRETLVYVHGNVSMAAKLLGAGSVTGVDIEEDSIRVSRENAARNGIAEQDFRLFLGNVLMDEALAGQIGDRQYDVIAANIVADIIKAMIPLFRRYLRPEGKMVCSGIIIERAEEVRDALLAGGLKVLQVCKDGEWAAIIAQNQA